MPSDYRDAYLESKVLSADPLQLVRMLYDGALKSVADARQGLKRGDIRGRSRAISKATEIITELVGSLDRERGGDVGGRLVELYDYMLRRLNDANREQIEAPLIEVQNLLETLAGAWREIAAPSPAATVYAASSEDYVQQVWTV